MNIKSRHPAHVSHRSAAGGLPRVVSINILCLLLFSTLIFAQQKVLVSPWGDAIPLKKGKAVSKVIQEYLKHHAQQSANCNGPQLNGYDPADFPTTINHTAQRGDVFAEWFQSGVEGEIDSVFFLPGDFTGSDGRDSAYNLRIFRSNIDETHGPGTRGYLPPERMFWGYYIDANDPLGVGAFPEDATAFDTVSGLIVPRWYSSYRWNLSNPVFDSISPSVGGAPWKPIGDGDPRDSASGKCSSTSVVCYWDTSLNAFPPMGEEIWGNGIGVPIKVRPNTISSVDLGIISNPNVRIGDAFFITLKILPNPDGSYDFANSEIAASSPDFGWPPEGNVQYHNWKFYDERN
ncbi:MAG TPA: hypothetical protein VKS81_00740, partial [Bacteroidota bacterium]|nr:hypothetical protein [Bacteroidota bacterium]